MKRQGTMVWLLLLFFCVAGFASVDPLLGQSQDQAAGYRLIANQGKTLCIFGADGTLEWKMNLKFAPHDLHLLDNGNLLTHQGTEVVEIDIKTKQVVWSFDTRKLLGAVKQKTEVHSVAPMAQNQVMIAISGARKIVVVDRQGKVMRELKLKVDRPHPHRDTRLVRPLKSGGFLVAHEGDGVVREYAPDGKVVWEYAVPMFGQAAKPGHGVEAYGNAVFSAIRLANGNTLIGTGNGHRVLEVTPAGEIAWQLTQNELPGIKLAWVTTLEVHSDGTMFIGNCHAGKDNPQLIQINRDKKVIWKFRDFKHLGNAVSNSQILDAKPTVVR